MYYTSSQNARVDRYEIMDTRPAIFEVLLIYDSPALIFESNGNIHVYANARYRVNAKIVSNYLKDFNRKYKTTLNLRKVQNAYKDNRPIYESEIDFVSKFKDTISKVDYGI